MQRNNAYLLDILEAARLALDYVGDKTKRRFLNEWVKAVNEHGGFGNWKWVVSKDPAGMKMIIETATRI